MGELKKKSKLSSRSVNRRCEVNNSLTLKWGTIKGWNVETDEALAALQKWADGGRAMGCAMQKDTPEQKQAILEVIDHMDEIWLDWEGKTVTREEAKEYITNYGSET